MGCKVTFSVTRDPEFHSSSWWAKDPHTFLEVLRQQIVGARAIWPELDEYEIRKKASGRGVRGGKAGGEARAAALTPERRIEIATAAANKRWGNGS